MHSADAELAASKHADFNFALAANIATGATERHVWLWANEVRTIEIVLPVFADLEPVVLRNVDGKWAPVDRLSALP